MIQILSGVTHGVQEGQLWGDVGIAVQCDGGPGRPCGVAVNVDPGRRT